MKQVADNKRKGFILLWRSICDNTLLNDGKTPFDKFHAWCDLLCMVNHEDKKVFVNGKPVIIKRGSKLTSVVKLADRWHWSRCRAMRYLNALELDNMIVTERTPNGTTITVINYDFYNSVRTTNDTSNDTTNDTPDDTTVDTQTNNYKSINEKIGNKKERSWPMYDNRGVLIEE